jgi:hypothetical protein
MREVADLINKERTSRATRCRPSLDARGEHEVGNDELAASFKQIEQAHLAVRSLEHIVLVDPDHRQPATFSGKRVSCTSGCFFFSQRAWPFDNVSSAKTERRVTAIEYLRNNRALPSPKDKNDLLRQACRRGDVTSTRNTQIPNRLRPLDFLSRSPFSVLSNLPTAR